MNIVDKLLKAKPSKEEFKNCVKVGDDFWKNAMKEQCELVEKQKEEQRGLTPSLKLYKMEFTL